MERRTNPYALHLGIYSGNRPTCEPIFCPGAWPARRAQGQLIPQNFPCASLL